MTRAAKSRVAWGGLLAAGLFAATLAGAAGSLLEARATPARLSPCGTALCRPDGSRFEWRGVTAFALAAHLANGRDADARRFVEWASGNGFNVLRVLAMNHGWLELPPDQGRRVLPRLFAMAGESGMYVQVVALAGTALPRFRTETFLREQVEAVGALCADADNCIMEIANEPYHSSQADLDTPDVMRALAALVPRHVPLAWGASSSHTSETLAGGAFVVAHLPRNGTRWIRVARRDDLAALSRKVGKFVVDNEPIGAAERAEPSRREDSPDAFFAQAAVSSLLGLGTTFHCDDCLHAKVPGPTQQEAAEAFARGARFVGEAGPVRRVPLPGGDAPVEPGESGAGSKVFAGVSESTAVVVALGPRAAEAVKWKPGWKARSGQAAGSEVHAWIADRLR